MSRHGYYCALLLISVLIFPAGLSSQMAGPVRPAVAASLVSAGCNEAIFPLVSGGPLPADRQSPHAFDVANLDRSVSPCDDFYRFANGGWIKSHPIPGDHAMWATFDQLEDQNQDVLRQILEEAAQDKAVTSGSNRQKIGDFYASCMDEAGIETVGAMPLEPELQRIAHITDIDGLQGEIARLQVADVNALFEFGSEQDPKDSTKMIATAAQGGLSLPDRQYYRDTDDRSKQLREAYVQHVTNMFALMGDDKVAAATEAKTVLRIETSLANASMGRADRRDPDKVYHKIPLGQLQQLMPQFSWEGYFREVNAPRMDSVDIEQPEFFKEVNAALSSVSLADWKIYLRWHLVHSVAPALSKKFVEENFNFFGRTLTGTKELLPRWRRCVSATDHALGEALGEYYVKRKFPAGSKAQAVAVVENLIAALRSDLSTLDWMSPATRQEAIKKLNAINLKIGYPDKWRDYTALHIVRTSYMENTLRGRMFESARDLAKIGKPVDRTEWDMTPPTVNAYYNPRMNEIVFPAGILQPPFFDSKGDPAINYGGIGAVIGHEMTHGFDDQGAKFDAQGNLKNWWTPEDLKNFQERGDCIAKQFESYQYEPGLHENGKLVEGESIADLGGVTIAYAAFEKTIHGNDASQKINGFTPEQRFFLGFAQIWASNYRPEFARLIVKTNEHPLDSFRTNGPLSNTPAFSKAFGCSAGSPMVRSDSLRCRIW